MTYYTENLCPNPSFEVSLSGYTGLTGTVLSQETTQGKYGHNSLKVVTDGSVSGEGFTGPQVTVPTGEGTTGSISFWILGETGTLTVSAVAGATATVVAQTTITLSGGDYQRVILSGLSLTVSQPMYFVIQTPTAQALTFWIDAVQYEMNSPAHLYIDGSFLNCAWEGTAGLSASYQAYQFMTSAEGGMLLSGRASPVTEGEIFKTSAEGSMLLSGIVSGTLDVNPVAALAAFGMWTTADMDPAVSFASWSNAGLSTGQTGWNRQYGLFYPPQQYVASGGQVLWNRAAYAAVGFWFKSLSSGWQESLTDVQWERMPVVPGTSPSPTAWQPPRQISTIVKPTRLNFAPNPSIAVSTAGWTAIASASVSQDNSIPAAQGSYSLKVTVNTSSDGAYLIIPDLIVGDTYVVSAATQAGAGLQDIVMSCCGVSASSSKEGVPYGGSTILGDGYGQGPYGGISASGSDMPTGQWFGPSLVFTATESTVILSFQILAGSDIAYPAHFWVDAILLEEGETVGTYFDGGFGADYSWETGGTAGLTRSYYYERQEVGTAAVSAALAQHTPLGILAATPTFSAPYTQ